MYRTPDNPTRKSIMKIVAENFEDYPSEFIDDETQIAQLGEELYQDSVLESIQIQFNLVEKLPNTAKRWSLGKLTDYVNSQLLDITKINNHAATLEHQSTGIEGIVEEYSPGSYVVGI